MNLGLLGAIGGVGQGLQTFGAGMQKQQEEQDREERSLIMNQKLMEAKDKIESDRRKRIAGKVDSEARAIAGKRQSGLLDASKNLQGPTQDGVPLADAESTKEAIKQEAEPTSRDRLQARANLGIGDNPDLDMLKVDSAERQLKKDESMALLGARKQDALDRQTDYNRIRDEAKLALQDRKLDLDSKRLEAMISGIGAWAKSSGASRGDTTSMIQNYAELERRGYSKEQIEKYLFEGKAPPATQSVTVKDDGFSKTTSTTTKGPVTKGGGTAPAPENDPLGLRKSK